MKYYVRHASELNHFINPAYWFILVLTWSTQLQKPASNKIIAIINLISDVPLKLPVNLACIEKSLYRHEMKPRTNSWGIRNFSNTCWYFQRASYKKGKTSIKNNPLFYPFLLSYIQARAPYSLLKYELNKTSFLCNFFR